MRKLVPIFLIVSEITIINLKRPIEGSGAEEVGKVFISTFVLNSNWLQVKDFRFLSMSQEDEELALEESPEHARSTPKKFGHLFSFTSGAYTFENGVLAD